LPYSFYFPFATSLKTSLPLLLEINNMKVRVLFLGLLFSCIAPSYGQMTLAHEFATGTPQSTIYETQVVNLALSGKKIAVMRAQTSSPLADTIFYYNLDYSFWKMIPCPSILGYWGQFWLGDPGGQIRVSYSSETLFNSDSLLEVAVYYSKFPSDDSGDKMFIINENGDLVDSIKGLYATPTCCQFTVHEIGPTTCIASVRGVDGSVRYYNLPGTIPCDACGSRLGLSKVEGKPATILSAPEPNPSKNQVKITFTLPEGANMGELTIYNTDGKKMKSYTVDNRFGFIMVDDSQFAPGVYYYNLMANGSVSSSQKMLVIK
jgi:Secretion system C-terminal sorting domain